MDGLRVWRFASAAVRCRQDMVQYMADPERFLDDMWQGLPGDQRALYLENLAEPGTWGGARELNAAGGHVSAFSLALSLVFSLALSLSLARSSLFLSHPLARTLFLSVPHPHHTHAHRNMITKIHPRSLKSKRFVR